MTLADGAVIALADWRDSGLRASFVVSGDDSGRPKWEPFDSSIAMPMWDGGPPATRAHSNLERPGSAGLPQGHRMCVFGWHACAFATDATVQTSSALRCWLHTSLAEFMYCRKRCDDVMLLDLVENRPRRENVIDARGELEMVPSDAADVWPSGDVIGDGDGPYRSAPPRKPTLTPKTRWTAPNAFVLPIDLRENLPFGVTVTACDSAALYKLCALLRHTESHVVVTIGLRGLQLIPV